MKHPRRRLLGGAMGLLATPAVPRFARAAEFSWRLGHTAPIDFPLHKRLSEAAAEIARETDGRVEIAILPNGELGGQLGLLSQVRGGTIDVTMVAGASLMGVLAAAYTQSVGFAFPDYARLWAAMDGDLGKALRTQMAQRLGLAVMERVWDFGFRQITTTTVPIRTAADLKGLKIRAPIDGDLIGLFRALKAAPLGLNLQDLVPALQNRALDGQEGLLPLVQAMRLQDMQSYCAITNHVWDGLWLCCNDRAWRRLPDKLRDVVAAAFNRAAVRQREDTAAADTAVRDVLTAQGMTFTTPDLGSFRAVLRGTSYYKEASVRAGDDAWAALEKYAGRLV